jgi:hypothetical protein
MREDALLQPALDVGQHLQRCKRSVLVEAAFGVTEAQMRMWVEIEVKVEVEAEADNAVACAVYELLTGQLSSRSVHRES